MTTIRQKPDSKYLRKISIRHINYLATLYFQNLSLFINFYIFYGLELPLKTINGENIKR